MTQTASTPITSTQTSILRSAAATSVFRWIAVLLALLVVGPIAGTLVERLHTPTGLNAPPPLLAAQTIIGAGSLVAIMAMALALGSVTAALVGRGYGMGVAGVVIGWGAIRSATFDDLLRDFDGRPPFVRLAIEGLVTGALAMLVALAIDKSAGQSHEPRPETGIRKGVLSPMTWSAVAGGVIAASIVAWIVAYQSLKGQTIAAGVFAGIVSAGVTQVMTNAQRGNVARLAPFLVTTVLAAGVPLAVMLLPGGPNLSVAAFSGKMPPLARVMPLDWVAGAFMGFPVGLGWARSILSSKLA